MSLDGIGHGCDQKIQSHIFWKTAPEMDLIFQILHIPGGYLHSGNREAVDGFAWAVFGGSVGGAGWLVGRESHGRDCHGERKKSNSFHASTSRYLLPSFGNQAV